MSHKRCLVVYAGPEGEFCWPLELPAAASIAVALAAARAAAGPAAAALPWDSAAIGVFGERRERDATFADGDRIELYRELRCDPRARRRERAARQRRAR